MSFPPYAEYKDSGVVWLGAVPGHWDLAAIKWMVDEKRPITYGIVQAGPDTPDGIPYIRPADMTPEQGVADMAAILRTTPEIAAPYARSVIREGDLVCSIGPSFGKVMVVPVELDGGNLTQGTARVAPNVGTNRRFLFWILRSRESVAQWESSIGGATFRALNLEPLANTLACLPPLAEQEAIAGFLDREVGKIDGLVAEQERLIALLKEKRQAVISHAVTKGLNPTAPLRDSGIEWLGQIPEHWEVKRLRHIATLNPSKSEVAAIDSATEVSFLPMEAIGEDGSLALDRTRAIAEVSTGYTYFREGDVTIAKITPCFENGKGAVMRGLVQGVGFGTTELIVVRPQENVTTSAYLDWVFRTRPFRALGEGAMYGAGGQKRVPDDFVRDFAIGIPPMGEQAQIIAYLDQILASFDALSSEAQSAIALLAERRAALISAAVTGKIDVRGAVAQPAITTSPQPSLQAVVGSYAILRFGKLGRMVVMKLGYLAEAHAGLSLGGHYTRYAAGPYDRNLCNAMERGAATACGIVIGEPQFEGGAVKYTIPSHCRTPSDELKALVGTDHAAAFEAMLTSLKDLNRDDIEAIATLYAVWNDLLAAGKQADDDSICSGVLNDWHPEKPLKFSRDQLVTWLEWMRRNGFVPDGTAPRTDHQGSLFG